MSEMRWRRRSIGVARRVAAMTGRECAMMHRSVTVTGLRAPELRILARASFKAEGSQPTAWVAAAYSKHRREDVLSWQPWRQTYWTMWLARLGGRRRSS